MTDEYINETIEVGSFKEFIADMMKRKSDQAELGMTLENGKQLKITVTIESIQ